LKPMQGKGIRQLVFALPVVTTFSVRSINSGIAAH
jgi:hypothetical protein